MNREIQIMTGSEGIKLFNQVFEQHISHMRLNVLKQVGKVTQEEHLNIERMIDSEDSENSVVANEIMKYKENGNNI